MNLKKNSKLSRFEQELRKQVFLEEEQEEDLPVLVKVASGTPEEFRIMLNVFVEEYCKKRGYRISTVSNLVETVSHSGSYSYRTEYYQAKDAKATKTNHTYELSQTFIFVKDTK